jgi:vacuole morphology and inheritance protein 14
MPFVPSLLTHVLPRMSHDVESIRQAAIKVNASLMDYIMSLSDDNRRPDPSTGGQIQLPTSLSALGKELTGAERPDSNLSARLLKTVIVKVPGLPRQLRSAVLHRRRSQSLTTKLPSMLSLFNS